MKLTVDKSKCIGSLPCTQIAPAVFKLGDDGKAHILDPKAATDEDIMKAAEACPQAAIIVHDDDGKQVYPVQESAD